MFSMFNNSSFDSESDCGPAVNTSVRHPRETDLTPTSSAGSRVKNLSELNITPASLELPSAPSSPAADTAQTFNSLEALHNLPRLQHFQLPSDLYSIMVSLVPSGEDQSYLFRYMYVSRLPPRLRMFAEGLHSLPNELHADVCDYLWGFWSDTDPAGPWIHRPTCRFYRSTRPGGLAQEYRSCRPVLPTARVRASPEEVPDCECWDQ